MLRCSSADPLRRRIYQMKTTGMSDQGVINAIVREEGSVALATPPTGTIGGVITWVMPGVALIIGFFVYSAYVKRNRKTPEPLSEVDRAALDRFRSQIDRELEEPGPSQRGPDPRT
jgi:cytochrome c-type biogenesis protein CcmH/NrfF